MNCEDSNIISSKESKIPYEGIKIQLSEQDAEILTADLALSKSTKDENLCRIGNDSDLLNINNIEEVPLLNIAVPINIDKWDGKEAIKVGYEVITEEDTEIKEITVYDSELNEYVFAQNDPNFSVIIIGINERSNYKNYFCMSGLLGHIYDKTF